MSSAQRHIDPQEELAPAEGLPPFALTQPDPAALKQQVADRLAAHRARRGQTRPALESAPQHTPAPSRVARTRAANIAAAVAERYAHSQTYRAFLAVEAERAVHQAEAAREVAAINAQAIAVAQQQLLANLDDWDSSAETVAGAHVPGDYAALFGQESSTALPIAATPAFEPPAEPHFRATSPASFTVRPFDDPAYATSARQSHPLDTLHPGGAPAPSEVSEDDLFALDEEIAFRHSPVFEELSQQEPIAANLIEFPRQLVAARKARPRIAEGPLREVEGADASAPQLRIFEVESADLSPAPAAESTAPEWSSILLSALPVAAFSGSADTDYLPTVVPQPAAISLRLMAALVDACLILTVEAAFAGVFTFALTHLSGQQAVLEIPRLTAVGGVVVTLAVLTLLYQLLFFSLSDATPGMRYARIALCTLSDENPTASARRQRILAGVLAASPLGLGLLWALLDEDTLGWHDRISRMYQRAY